MSVFFFFFLSLSVCFALPPFSRRRLFPQVSRTAQSNKNEQRHLPHGHCQLLGVDGARAIGVEEVKGFAVVVVVVVFEREGVRRRR